MGGNGFWLSSTEFSSTDAWLIDMYSIYTSVNRFSYLKKCGYSVRCLRDSSVTQINDNSIDKHIQIYPNPTIDKVFINISKRQDLKMQIYNVVGECVLQRELNSGTNEIDISYLTTGIYVIKLTGTDRTFQQKLIKE